MTEEPITKPEQRLIREVRDLKFGSMTIHVKNGQPYRIENRLESIMLSSFTGEA